MIEPMRIAIEAWSPEYGSPVESAAPEVGGAAVDPDVEVPSTEWRPLDPTGVRRPPRLDFTDGVRRIDARVWLTDDDGITRLGVCASYGAGMVTCDGRAGVTAVEIRRGLFAPAGAPELRTQAGDYPPRAVVGQDIQQFSQAIQDEMRQLEVRIAEATGSNNDEDERLLVVDGPLRGRQHLGSAVGYIKSHQVGYLPDALSTVVASLHAGQRTPLFVTQTTWRRYSWYLRLPGSSGHPWSGIVRCEASADLALERARQLADQTARVLPEYAASPHKDPRAPQNLYPIGGLERELRRRLGDAAWVYRSLRVAATKQ